MVEQVAGNTVIQTPSPPILHVTGSDIPQADNNTNLTEFNFAEKTFRPSFRNKSNEKLRHKPLQQKSLAIQPVDVDFSDEGLTLQALKAKLAKDKINLKRLNNANHYQLNRQNILDRAHKRLQNPEKKENLSAVRKQLENPKKKRIKIGLLSGSDWKRAQKLSTTRKWFENSKVTSSKFVVCSKAAGRA